MPTIAGKHPFKERVAIIVNKRVWNEVLGCNLKNDRLISVHFQGKQFNITVIQVCAPTSNAEEAEVEWFYEDLQDLLEHLHLQSLNHVQLSATQWTVAHKPLFPWYSSGKNTGVCCHFLLQGIFPIQWSGPLLLNLQADPLLSTWEADHLISSFTPHTLLGLVVPHAVFTDKEANCNTGILSKVRAENQRLDSNPDCLALEVKLWPPGEAGRKQQSPEVRLHGR